MEPRRILRWLGIGVGSVLAVGAALIAVFVAVGIPIDLSGLRGGIQKAASQAIGRKVAIDGPLLLVPALRPTVEVTGVTVANAEGWAADDFLRLGLARVRLGILPLLEGRIEIVEVTVEDLRVKLETDSEGRGNWLPAAPRGDAEVVAEPAAAAPPQLLHYIELWELTLRDIAIVYRDGADGTLYDLKLNEIQGSARDNEAMQLYVQGAVQGIAYGINLTGGSLAALLAEDEPWPVDLSLAMANANLQVTGEIAQPLRGVGVDLAFALDGQGIRAFEPAAGIELPPLGKYALSGQFTQSETVSTVSKLKGSIGKTSFTGNLEVDISGPRPRLAGTLAVAEIDARPLLAALRAADQGEAPGLSTDAGSEPEIDLDEAVLALDLLREFDAEFALSMATLRLAKGDLRDASLSVSVRDGVLTAPLSLDLAGVPFSGKLSLSDDSDAPQVAAELRAARTNIGDLARLLYGIEGVEGAFESAEVALAAEGASLRALVSTLDFRFALVKAALSYGNDSDGDPVGFTLDSASITLPRGEAKRIVGEGTLLDVPLSLELTGPDAFTLLSGQDWPFTLTAAGGGAGLEVEGRIGAEGAGSELTFQLAGERLGDLERWLGVSPDVAVAYALSGRVQVDKGEARVSSLQASVGQSGLRGELGFRIDGAEGVIRLALDVATIDTDELAGLVPDRDPPAEQDDDAAFSIDVPILPKGIELQDADIDLSVAQIRMEPSHVTDLSFNARIRDGRVGRSPFQATFAATRFAGDVSLDLTGASPKAGFSLGAGPVDVGGLLKELDLVEGLEASAGELKLNLEAEGSTLRQLVGQASLSATLREGSWTLEDPDSGAALEILVPQGSLSAAPGTAIRLALDGRIAQTPVKIDIETDPLDSFTEPKDRLSLGLRVELAGARLALDADAALPVERRDLAFELALSGDRLDSFDELLGVSLPPWGPYALGGRLAVRQGGYEVEGFKVEVGASDLQGGARLDMSGVRPDLQIDLATNSLQVDDFDVGDWSPLQEESETAAAAAAAPPEADEKTAEALLTPEVMRSLDARLTLQVKEVLSGADRLGDGTLTAQLKDGRFSVAPLQVNIPGGSVDVAFAYEPRETQILAEASARIEKLDYGVLARRIESDSPVGGLISVDIDLASEAEDLERVMENAYGHLDFAIWPEDLNAGIFDLWAVNLLTAVLPTVDSDNQSKINCVIARFAVDDGIMTPKAVLVDSSRVQASARGTVDFKAETIDLRLAPRAKKPQMFSAATPIRVRGTFDDFGVGVSTGSVLGTIVRMSTSVVTVPFEWVFTSPVAADGKAACAEAWGRPPGS